MTSSLSTRLDATFKGVELGSGDDDRLAVSIPREAVVPVLTFLKEEGYDYLQLISCVDWIDRGEFELVYLLSFYTEDEVGGD
ncbi:NADH-quinone oxidoreductase subunit C, partial [bacterium]|nr:NADH-quinone oxidoreductase subunit C [bacterium]